MTFENPRRQQVKRFSLPVLMVTLVAAALVQDLAPISAYLPVKPPLLLATALYAILHRPFWVVLLSVSWAGALHDALGGLPPFCTIGFLLLLYAAVTLMQHFLLLQAHWQGALLVAVSHAAHQLWFRCWAGLGGSFFSIDGTHLVGASLLTGLVGGYLTFLLCGWADVSAGLLEAGKEGHGAIWSNSDR